MGGQKYEVVEQSQSFGTFLWNGRTNEFLGRNGTSWLKIFVFYVFLYLFLAAFFAMAMAVFYQTISYERPTYSPGEDNSILRSPALGHRPLPHSDNIESSLIWFNVNDPATYKHWVASLDEFMGPYVNKTKGAKYVPCSDDKPRDAEKDEICDVDVTKFGTDCSIANKWGFPKGQPCILLKMNRMYKWTPDTYATKAELDKAENMPEALMKKITTDTETGGAYKKMIWVHCEGENEHDKEYVDEVQYFPQQGFPAFFFPYLNNEGYLQPVIAVQFKKVSRNVLVNVECSVWSQKIKHVRKTKLGIAHFEFLIDEKPKQM